MFATPLLPLRKMLAFMWGNNNYIALLSNMFNSSCWRINIVLTKDDIHILVDIVIVDPTRTDLFLRSCTTQGLVAFNVVQSKKWSYCDRHLTNQFLPLTMEGFRCLHKQADVFLHNCANAVWSLKRLKCPPLFVLFLNHINIWFSNFPKRFFYKLVMYLNHKMNINNISNASYKIQNARIWYIVMKLEIDNSSSNSIIKPCVMRGNEISMTKWPTVDPKSCIRTEQNVKGWNGIQWNLTSYESRNIYCMWKWVSRLSSIKQYTNYHTAPMIRKTHRNWEFHTTP